MEYQSILGAHRTEWLNPDEITMPKFFYDLNLDQVVEDILEEQKLYDLRRYYYTMADATDITYRIEVLKDIDQEEVYQSIVDFALGMRTARQYLTNSTESDHEIQMQKWKLDAANCYIHAVEKLHTELHNEKLQSEGLIAFRNWLQLYIKEESYQALKKDTEQLLTNFDEMKFIIQIKRDRIIIHQGYLEEDYGKQLLDTFRQTSQQDHFYQNNPFTTNTLAPIERAVFDVLKKPYASVFEELKNYDQKYKDFFDTVLNEFELESQFYIAFRSYRKDMEYMNFHFCYPGNCDGFSIIEGYDLALAKVNAQKKKPIIFNDAYFKPEEQFFVVTGPNQGGKTTFARAIGQILYFHSIGLMVPARSVNVPAFDGIYTHFAADEAMDSGAGKLKEELLRLKPMMDQVNRRSFVIINEIFTSATSYDAYIMGKKVLNNIMEKGCMGIYVTHIYELTKEDDRIVSLVAALKSEDSNIRSFKIKRQLADGRSYANTIVEKYHMTYEEIKERI